MRPWNPTLLALGLALLGLPLTSPALAVRYRVEVVNTWSPETHPGAFPGDAHFSWIGGATHDDGVAFWAPGTLASPGVQEMAETGRTDILLEEVAAAVDAGHAARALDWRWWFCPAATVNPACGPLEVEFEIDDAHPRVTLVTMLGPSPDWFVGVTGLPLRQDGLWRSRVEVELHPFDGGTRDANRFALFGPLTTPPAPVAPVSSASGQLIGPASLGRLVFTRVPECDDGRDNDGDGRVDFGPDPGCVSPLGFEDPQCDDGEDNDGDGRIDWDGAGVGLPDPDCAAPTDNRESAACGLGFELAFGLPALLCATQENPPSGTPAGVESP